MNQWMDSTENFSGNSRLLINGDINIDALKWENKEYYLKNLSSIVHEVMQQHDIVHLVNAVTRVGRNAKNELTRSCLDHIYSNKPQLCSPIQVIPTGASDHDKVLMKFYCKQHQERPA